MEAVVMVGNVGCGKSTMAKEYADKFGHKVFNGDAITLMLGAGTYKWDKKDCSLIADMRELFIDHCVRKDFSFLIDSTNMTMRQRDKIFNQITSNYDTTIIDFGPGTEESLQRRIANAHGKEDWRSIHNRFHKAYCRPYEGEADFIDRRY